jgi:hypothetical protein
MTVENYIMLNYGSGECDRVLGTRVKADKIHCRVLQEWRSEVTTNTLSTTTLHSHIVHDIFW